MWHPTLVFKFNVWKSESKSTVKLFRRHRSRGLYVILCRPDIVPWKQFDSRLAFTHMFRYVSFSSPGGGAEAKFAVSDCILFRPCSAPLSHVYVYHFTDRLSRPICHTVGLDKCLRNNLTVELLSILAVFCPCTLCFTFTSCSFGVFYFVWQQQIR